MPKVKQLAKWSKVVLTFSDRINSSSNQNLEKREFPNTSIGECVATLVKEQKRKGMETYLIKVRAYA
jgi:hypothetical protein